MASVDLDHSSLFLEPKRRIFYRTDLKTNKYHKNIALRETFQEVCQLPAKSWISKSRNVALKDIFPLERKRTSNSKKIERNVGRLQGSSADPVFVETIPNVTIPIGRDAVLQCSVDDLENYKGVNIKTMMYSCGEG
ncbi:hypothetical protein CEXT_549371 [Caerostris extrusa]|uniref:Uncharacterized protein n=1 Tax=Caerostris extrusa TaxID=172846 RepID=A0AAV4MLP6_CAEEX|nr:hypothetical protein CEXT_549371 [Caerostris extrusa]